MKALVSCPRSSPHSPAEERDKQATENTKRVSRIGRQPTMANLRFGTLAGLGGLITLLTWAGLALHVPGSDSVGSPARTQVFIGLMAVAAIGYFAAVRQVLRHPSGGRHALLLVLAVTAAMRVPLLPAPPFLSSDMYRYVWDGRVQAEAINPYRYVPDDPALAGLRDAAIYPHVNRRTYAPTIYAPAAEMVFAAVGRLSQSVLAMKTAMLIFEIIGMACIIAVLRRAGLPPTRVLIYAWNPLAAWCFAGNGHVDAIAIGCIGLALLARSASRPAAAGIALAVATLTKFLPAVIAPALWRRWDWRLPAALVLCLVVLYIPYIGVGWKVLGFLPGYGQQEGLANGSGIWLLAGIGRMVAVPKVAIAGYATAAIACLGALAVWVAWRPRPLDAAEDISRVCGDAGILAAVTMTAISPHYPWYFVWLGLPSCVQPYRAVVWLSAAPLILYLNPLNEHFLWPCLLYVPAIVLAVLDLAGTGTSLISRRTLAAGSSG